MEPADARGTGWGLHGLMSNLSLITPLVEEGFMPIICIGLAEINGKVIGRVTTDRQIAELLHQHPRLLFYLHALLDSVENAGRPPDDRRKDLGTAVQVWEDQP